MAADHWNEHARRWSHVGPPLRPCAADIVLLQRRIAEHADADRSLLLGVTPEIAGMDWPDGTDLLAVDRSQGMIDGVFPVAARADRRVVLGDWLALPVPDGDRSLAIGDGCFTLLSYPEGYDALFSEVHRALMPGGTFIVRHFVRPELPEPPEAVVAALRDGSIGSFHAFKWRLAMALHGTVEQGVSVGAVHRAFEAAVPERAALVASTGWSRGSIDTIDSYRDVDTPYTFPTLAELRARHQGLFEELSVDELDYELGDRCPSICYRRCGT